VAKNRKLLSMGDAVTGSMMRTLATAPAKAVYELAAELIAVTASA
jgi:hypothetical protein